MWTSTLLLHSCRISLQFCLLYTPEPSGPPTKKTVAFVNESTISFSWSAPEPELQNGVIIHYRVCIREMQSGPESSCTRTTQISANDDNNSFMYSGLSPSKEYIVMVKAATVVGLGPPAFILKTSGRPAAACFQAVVVCPRVCFHTIWQYC